MAPNDKDKDLLNQISLLAGAINKRKHEQQQQTQQQQTQQNPHVIRPSYRPPPRPTPYSRPGSSINKKWSNPNTSTNTNPTTSTSSTSSYRPPPSAPRFRPMSNPNPLLKGVTKPPVSTNPANAFGVGSKHMKLINTGSSTQQQQQEQIQTTTDSQFIKRGNKLIRLGTGNNTTTILTQEAQQLALRQQKRQAFLAKMKTIRLAQKKAKLKKLAILRRRQIMQKAILSKNKTTASVEIGGVQYTKTGSSLVRKDAPTHQHPSLTRTSSTGKQKTIVINGIEFVMDSSRKKLVRKSVMLKESITRTKPQQSSQPQQTPRHVIINNISYVRTKNGNLIRLDLPTTHKSKNKTLRRPKHKPRTTKQDPTDPYCFYYTRYGKCNHPITCERTHDPQRIRLCPSALRTPPIPCPKPSCTLTHTRTDQNTPHCIFWIERGYCRHYHTNSIGSGMEVVCPFLHVKLPSDAGVCEQFINSRYCAAGKDCTMKHYIDCPEWVLKGSCAALNEGRECRLFHAKRKEVPVGEKRGVDVMLEDEVEGKRKERRFVIEPVFEDEESDLEMESMTEEDEEEEDNEEMDEEVLDDMEKALNAIQDEKELEEFLKKAGMEEDIVDAEAEEEEDDDGDDSEIDDVLEEDAEMAFQLDDNIDDEDEDGYFTSMGPIRLDVDFDEDGK